MWTEKNARGRSIVTLSDHIVAIGTNRLAITTTNHSIGCGTKSSVWPTVWPILLDIETYGQKLPLKSLGFHSESFALNHADLWKIWAKFGPRARF
jgi:hypothetical protein